MKAFFSLIDRMNVHPDQQPQLEAMVWDVFGCEKAVFALDMSGFSLTVRREGILAYLRKIRRMQALALPVLRRHDGDLVKCDADNLMVVFSDCNDAVRAALGVMTACAADHLPVSIGLDFGRILLIPDADCYGDAVNLAYKLGEDLARAGEVLVTDAVQQRLDPDAFHAERQHLSISGLELDVWRINPVEPS
jgi:adenylate cyclase